MDALAGSRKAGSALRARFRELRVRSFAGGTDRDEGRKGQRQMQTKAGDPNGAGTQSELVASIGKMPSPLLVETGKKIFYLNWA
jgi:hypothetical protein